jgi:hypothetical protein
MQEMCREFYASPFSGSYDRKFLSGVFLFLFVLEIENSYNKGKGGR